MRDERPGRRSPCNGMQRRRLDLAVAPFLEETADPANDADALQRAIEQHRVVDEIEIPMPEPKLHLRHAGPLVGMRIQRFREVRQLVREDRRFAAARLAEAPFDADEIAEIEFLRDLPAELADLLLAQVDLDPARPVEDLGLFVLAFDVALGQLLDRLAGPVPEIEEVDLPLDPATDDATRHLDARPLVVGDVGRQSQDLGDRHVAIEALTPRIDAERDEVVELVAATGFEDGIGHGRIPHGGKRDSIRGTFEASGGVYPHRKCSIASPRPVRWG